LSKVILPITAAGSFIGIGFCVVAEFPADATPLPHTSFLPDLTHVYFNPLTTEINPACEQLAPAEAVAACAGRRVNVDATIMRDVKIESLRISVYLSVDLGRYEIQFCPNSAKDG
jgi:hypothetical protein